ncbi:protein-tyrosine phosphatase family protein [Faunimonas sp. B44]|uniref:protein-tyrosine phosphatase family protein n=1 Tax=Faunimonas sp. B44 TaxID=3461493 RepID=UPI0040448321
MHPIPHAHDLRAVENVRPASAWSLARRCNLSWITDTIAVGGRFPESEVPRLAAVLRIGCVVDLREECCDDRTLLEAHGIEFLHLPTLDLQAVSQPMLDRGVDCVTARVRRNRRVLIHCEHGIGRSALLALCVLVENGLAPIEALARAKDRRAVVSPSPAQYEAWAEWLRRRFREGERSWSIPDFDAFKAIAYRHLAG